MCTLPCLKRYVLSVEVRRSLQTTHGYGRRVLRWLSVYAMRMTAHATVVVQGDDNLRVSFYPRACARSVVRVICGVLVMSPMSRYFRWKVFTLRYRLPASEIFVFMSLFSLSFPCARPTHLCRADRGSSPDKLYVNDFTNIFRHDTLNFHTCVHF